MPTNPSKVKTNLSFIEFVGKRGVKVPEFSDDREGVAPDTESLRIGKRIALLIDYLGNDKSAEISGKSVRQLKRYAEGAEPPFKVLRKLSEAGDVSFEWLVHGNTITAADLVLHIEELRDDLAGINALLKSEANLTPDEITSLREEQRLIDDLISSETRLLELKRKAKHRNVEELDSLGRIIDEWSGEHRPSQASGGMHSQPQSGELSNPFMIAIPAFEEVRPAAGDGTVATSHQQTSIVAFDRQWLHELGVNPPFAKILFAEGDSMYPTIPNGSPMLVDTSKIEIRHGCIYVFDLDGDLMVKRIERLPDGTIDLISDNRERYPTRNITRDRLQQMHVIGRVFSAVRMF